MEDDTTAPINDPLQKRHSFSGRLWKQLRFSKRKVRPKSFVSYCSEDKTSEAEESFISQPSNFQRHEIDRENFSLEHNAIQECPFDVTGYGKLIMKDEFKLKRPRRKKVTVFLFEKIIVLTSVAKKEEIYYYYASIKISNLSLAPLNHNKKKILIKDFTNSRLSKNDIEYKLEARTEEMQNTWREIIQKSLWLQLLSAKEEQNGFV